LSSSSFTGSPDPRQRPFGPGHQPRIRPVIRVGGRRSQPSVSRFPAAFRPPALACRVILFPPGDWAFLTVGLPGALRPDPDGVSTFRTARYDRGGCPLYPGDGGALPARCRARPSPAASQRPVPAPRTRIPPAGLRFTRHQRGFTRFTRPACPSPVTTRMGPAVLGLSPVLRTPPLPATHDRAGPGVSTRPELRGRHNRPSNPRVHSRSATSCRNGKSGRSPPSAAMHKNTDLTIALRGLWVISPLGRPHAKGVGQPLPRSGPGG